MLAAEQFINRGARRWYRLEHGRDLLGDLVAVRRWGGLGSAAGGQSVRVLESPADLAREIAEERRRREAHGYSRG